MKSLGNLISDEELEYFFGHQSKMIIIANPFDKKGGCFYDGSYRGVSFDDFIDEFVFNEEGVVFVGGRAYPEVIRVLRYI